MKWTAHSSRPELSVHQRLLAQVEVLVDGAELAKRMGKGQFVIFVQFSDEQGHRYQNHATIDLKKLAEGIGSQDVNCIVSAFVLPGDYRVAIAVFVSATGEHSTREEKLHVPPLKSDPLPDMWRYLPAVEFTQVADPPDAWYLPTMTGRLHLSVETRRPVSVDVIVNLTPSERLGSNHVSNGNLRVLIPALKAISQVDFHNASLNVELLDLSRRKVVFRQDGVHELHWAAISNALADKGPGVIDVKSLQERQNNAGFFVKEAVEKLASAKPPRALIILTSPMAFGEGEDLEPTSATTPAGCRVFYIRYHVPPAPRSLTPGYPPDMGRGAARRPMGGTGRGAGTPRPSGRESQIDQLEPMLKPLGPKLFDVQTPEQFRKVLATILAEISSM